LPQRKYMATAVRSPACRCAKSTPASQLCAKPRSAPNSTTVGLYLVVTSGCACFHFCTLEALSFCAPLERSKAMAHAHSGRSQLGQGTSSGPGRVHGHTDLLYINCSVPMSNYTDKRACNCLSTLPNMPILALNCPVTVTWSRPIAHQHQPPSSTHTSPDLQASVQLGHEKMQHSNQACLSTGRERSAALAGAHGL